jgi:uncharacterized protein (DUF927 family)
VDLAVAAPGTDAPAVRTPPFTVTVFPDVTGRTAQVLTLELATLVARVADPLTHPSKAQCRLIKLARFGEQRTAADSLRHDGNVLEVSGVEGDHDAGTLALPDAVARCAQAGIAAVFYTTPSHTPERPRWRVLAPLSRPHPPAERRRFAAWLNGVLGGALAPESFRLSQAFYIGRVAGVPYDWAQSDGAPLDTLPDLAAGAIDPDAVPIGPTRVPERARAARAQDADPVLAGLRSRGLVQRDRADGGVDITCPFAADHTTSGGPGDTVYWPPHTGGYLQGHFHCLHTHCAQRTDAEFLAALGPPAGAEGDAATPADTQPSHCAFAGGQFRLVARGVEYVGADKDGGPQPPRWVCSPLRLCAKTRDDRSGEWGRLLEWEDADGTVHRWAMPMELLQGDGSEVRRELARRGLAIAPGRQCRELLAAYLQVWPVEARARCVDRLGWHGGVYVTPTALIGETGEQVVFQNAQAIEPALAVAGTVAEWRDSVAALARGNSRLVFAASVAFAGPLAHLAGEDSGGFHLRGPSSSGKSTALRVAASVWGEPSTYVRLWRATANGLEGLAALHNDGLLILDELSQMDPREAGEAAYLLANGQGKARAARNGTVRAPQRWRVLFLSAGEESLAGLMARAGKQPTAGQEIRLADIEADAGQGLGLFDVLHIEGTPAAQAFVIKEATTRWHGAVGVEWLRRLVADRTTVADRIAAFGQQFCADVLPAEAVGQVTRVARRFALVAAAGELATASGLTGWATGEASSAARICFKAWLEGFGGTGSREERAFFAQVRAFFEAHGASRFAATTDDAEPRVINRAGFYRDGNQGEREFLVLPEVFRREVCAGFDSRAATRWLREQGWLLPGADGKATQKPRLKGLGPTRCYVIAPRFADGDD